MNNSLKLFKNYYRKDISFPRDKIIAPFGIRHFFNENLHQGFFKSASDATHVKSMFSNHIIRSLSESDFEQILPYLELVSPSHEDNIYQPEEAIKFVYFPEDTVFSQFHILKDGRTTETAMIGREGFAGLQGITSSRTSNHFLQCLIGGIALRLRIEIFRQKLEKSNSFRELLFSFSNSFIKQISQRLICSNHHLLDQRTCCWILMILDRTQNDEIELTHDQIAGYLGVHRPSITHIAQTLREKNIIKYSRGKIVVVNRQKLENSACECYTHDNFLD